MWANKNRNEQFTVDMISKANSIIGSLVMYGKKSTNDDKGYTDLHDDRKEVVTKNQYTGNDHYAREAAGDIQLDDHGKLVEELLQPVRELVNDIETDADMICIVDEPSQAEHKVNYDKVYADIHDDRKEVVTTDHYTREAADEIQPDEHEYLMKELWQPDRESVSNTAADTDVICIKDGLGHTLHEESCPEALIDDDKT